MAQLKIDVIVDDNGAVQKLDAIEAAEKRVQSANSGTASSITSQARSVVASFSDQEKSAVRAASAAETLAVKTNTAARSASAAVVPFSQWAGANSNSAKAMADYIKAASQSAVATESVATAAESAAPAFTASSAAAGLSATAMSAVAGAAVLAAAAVGALVGFVADSSAKYIEQSTEMQGVRDELGRLDQAWKDFQFTIGAAAIGGDSAPILDFLHLLETGLIVVEAKMVQMIAEARGFWGALLPAGKALDALDIIFNHGGVDQVIAHGPPPSPTLIHPFADGQFQGGLLGSTASSLFDQSETERRRQEAANERARQADQRAIDELTGATTLRAFDDFTRRLQVAGGLTTQTNDKVKEYAKTVFDVIEKHGALGDSADKNWERAKDAALNAIDAIEARLRISFDSMMPFIGSPIDTQMALLEGAFGQGRMTVGSGVPLDSFTGTIGTPLGNEQRPGAFDLFNGFIPGTPLQNETPPDISLLQRLMQGGGFASLTGMLGGSLGSRGAERYLTTAEQLLGPGGLNLFHAGDTGMAVGGGMASVGLGLMMNSQGKLANAASGALTGAGIGTMIMPGIGTAIGAGVGALAGYIKGLLSQAGRNLVKQYADSMGGFDALHAQMSQLGDDGEQLWIKLTQGVGHANASQAKQVIGEIQQAFTELQARIDSLKKTVSDLSGPGVLASLDQLKAIAGAGNSPEEQAALQQYYQQQTGNAVSGLSQFVGSGAITSQATAQGAVGATLATFQLLQNQGLSMSAIMAQLGPVVTTLKQQLLEAGLQGGDTFGTLIHYTDLFANVSVQHASDGLQGMVNTETALANVGQLTSDTFAGLNHAILDTAAALQKQGLSGADIDMVLHPALQRAWELEQDFHVQADAGTQALIDQAVAAGTVGEAFRSPMQQLTDAIKAMTQAFRSFLGDVSNGLPAAANAGVAAANRAFRGLDPGNRTSSGGGEPPDTNEPNDPSTGLPRAHSGGPIWRRMHVGGLAYDEVPIIGQTGEFMVSRRGVAAVGVNTLRRINSGQVSVGGSGGGTANIYLDGQLIATAVVPHLPGAVRNVVPRYS